MRDSTLNTLTVPAVGSVNPAVIVKAPKKTPLRVVVRNVGAVIVFLSFTTEDISGPAGPSTSVFQLPIGTSEVFVAAPMQSMYAISAGVAGLVSVAASDAFPIEVP